MKWKTHGPGWYFVKLPGGVFYEIRNHAYAANPAWEVRLTHRDRPATHICFADSFTEAKKRAQEHITHA